MLSIDYFIFSVNLGTGYTHSFTNKESKAQNGKSLARDHTVGKRWGWDLDLKYQKLTIFCV